MALTSGAQLGPFRITEALGAGGMGEVYRALDTRLDRHVALKLILEALVADPDRAMRFAREAKTLAAVNHPHIATLYGIEQIDGRHVLVMGLDRGAEAEGAAVMTGSRNSLGDWLLGLDSNQQPSG